MHIKIGTRGSKLALWQAHFVEEKLQEGGISTEVVIIKTMGDKILDKALSKIGSKGIFTEELEAQLHNGGIDIAVHSAKDLQSDLGDDFEILAFTEREKSNDVLISHDTSLSLNQAKPFIIGTSSTRRIALLKHFYPHLTTVDMRGNLQTRLRKLSEGHCDALLLAYAGVHRMGYDAQIAEYLSLEEFTPAVGQGSVAIECAVSLDEAKKEAVGNLLNHVETSLCLRAERAFLRRLQGGCSVPLFALATLVEGKINISGGVVSLDGSEMIRRQVEEGSPAHPEKIGASLAEELLDAGAERVLDEIKNAQIDVTDLR
ncbi:hydroxymethylbilane synthase [Persicitalea sp.]|uniref:hydroxymethylbilane synthase n=1 Tax=Persicitalea sp. TaxID=3100273 RepID=UPI00359394C0